jgi:hypothetical protein
MTSFFVTCAQMLDIELWCPVFHFLRFSISLAICNMAEGLTREIPRGSTTPHRSQHPKSVVKEE